MGFPFCAFLRVVPPENFCRGLPSLVARAPVFLWYGGLVVSTSRGPVVPDLTDVNEANRRYPKLKNDRPPNQSRESYPPRTRIEPHLTGIKPAHSRTTKH